MKSQTGIKTSWTDVVSLGGVPNSDKLKNHLLEIHKLNAGFTENCSQLSRDSEGRNTYEWLAEVIDRKKHHKIVDLGCGSGFLLNLCNKKFHAGLSLTGVDMSSEELALAREKLPPSVKLYKGLAQDLNFIKNEFVDVILCHWALTLMDSVELVLSEIKRVLKTKGVFAAIVDGDSSESEQYCEINEIIYRSVEKKCSNYRSVELGDIRIRSKKSLMDLLSNFFPISNIKIQSQVFKLYGEPEYLAKEVMGFYYACFLLPEDEYLELLVELAVYFKNNRGEKTPVFCMPVNRVLISAT
ncbi:MAG: hypothetical protein CBC42_01275 [Betaproteobacteria bacterium TMED82]|nr:MAG: hypothetical protein CBC42_01275 [Betaproteobacteria bacterium TMED82]|tara:strand:- start:3971 stop:4864 length:894 start_codon:yes stop_codon:yes gene_type:complete